MNRLDVTWRGQQPDWIAVTPLSAPDADDAIAWQQAGLLDRGEAEALALARQLNADWFVTDDTAARVLAKSVGVEAHGSLGIVLWAAAAGHLTRAPAEEALNRLANSSLWISARILAEARAALDQLFPTQKS
ncbi:MAG TPA: DUF3368 domain-containing protein [Blastocatellia bacterium]|nr:DUF3368 domain-containing protein [Blastocatellia bacterium]